MGTVNLLGPLEARVEPSQVRSGPCGPSDAHGRAGSQAKASPRFRPAVGG